MDGDLNLVALGGSCIPTKLYIYSAHSSDFVISSSRHVV